MFDLRELLESYGDATALVDEAGRETSYRELVAAAAAFAARVGPARRLVFLEALNAPGSITAYVGCLIGGHPVYLFQKQDEGRLPGLVERYHPHVVVRFDADGMIFARRHDEALDLHPELRLLLSTSGSTGSPKFVKLSAANLLSNAAAIAEYLRIERSDRAITSLKFNYSYGLSVINSHLVSGASLLLTHRSVGEPEFWTLFDDRRATSFAGVPYTMETLSRMEHRLAEAPRLRYVTQAGGKLSPALVRRFAELARQGGWRFYVMYGQTEAAPRIAYLPHEMAEAYPDAIGRAIPGGRIEILGEDGAPITEPGRPGQLVYSGPNVMMGYAEDASGLGRDDSRGRLFTGDIAQWNEAGLVRIVGRAGRFVKPFGIRINLDEVEAEVRANWPEAACTGTDEYIVVAVRSGDPGAIVSALVAKYALPAFVFRVLTMREIPRLPNGKVDYRTILAAAGAQASAAATARERALKESARRTELILARNQMITLLVSGLWHGAAWTFVSWGFFHGVMLVAQQQVWNRVKGFCEQSRGIRIATILLQMATVFVLVAVSRILFRAESLHDAWIVFRKILTGPYNWGGLDGKASLAIGLAVIFCVTAAEAAVELGVWRRHFARRRVLRTGAALMVLLITLLLGDFTVGRFIYVRF